MKKKSATLWSEVGITRCRVALSKNKYIVRKR